MNGKRNLVIFLVLAVILSLAACTRSLSPATKAPAESEAAMASESAPSDVMGQLELLVTQTAMAMQAQGTTAPSDAYPAPQEGTAIETPQPGEAAAPAASDTTADTSGQTAPVTVPTATPGLPSTYVLQPGEHPYCIARRFNVNPGELLNLSGLGGNSVLSSGVELQIPHTGNPFPSARSLRPHPTTYTVSAGETIYTIACQFGDVDPNDIIAANQLKSPYKLTTGQTLQIP